MTFRTGVFIFFPGRSPGLLPPHPRISPQCHQKLQQEFQQELQQKFPSRDVKTARTSGHSRANRQRGMCLARSGAKS